MLVDIARTESINAAAPVTVGDSSSGSALEAVVLQYARRGVRLQILLRAVLVAFAVLTVVIVAPLRDRTASDVVVGVYAVCAIAVGVWSWSAGRSTLRFGWVALFGDLAALATLTLLAGGSARESWTADVLVNGFFLVPLMAATQLRTEVSAAVVVPTVAVYLLSSILTKSANAEPWSSIALRTLVLAGLGCGAIALTWIQRWRVATISQLVRDRTRLLTELIGAEDRERRALAEHLHDGALQYVLGARLDLEDARELADPDAFSRLDQALSESSRLLRSTVGELHPAVLEQAGLVRAIRELAENAGASAALSVALELDQWSPGLRTSADSLLYAAARELLANVVKHADAQSVTVTLAHRDSHAELTVADDGRGIPVGALSASVGQGHIGLASYRTRVEAAGGSLHVEGALPSGTIAHVELPAVPTELNGAT